MLTTFIRNRIVIALVLAASVLLPHSAYAENQNHGDVRLVSDATKITPGETFRLGVLYTLPEHAHIYWRHPGDSGLATGIEWALPGGFSVGELRWPNPERFVIEEIDDVSFGYAGEVLLFAEVTAPETLTPGEEVTLSVEPYWLICLDSGACVPESASAEIAISVGQSTASGDATLFEAYANRVPALPTEATPLDIAHTASGSLRLTARAGWEFIAEDSAFYPNEGRAWDLAASSVDTLEFECVDPEATAAVGGVLTVSLVNAKTGEKTIEYLVVE